MSRPIKKILVANRGEIALRVFRTCAEMNIRTVAIFSEIDASAPFVRFADEAYPLHGSTAAESYLSHEKIIEIARRSGVDAIHPGYGFLSENEDFAAAVLRAGIIFIGPPPEVIQNLGDKTAARTLARKLGIPLIPGSREAINTVEEAKRIALEIGLPVLLKAAGGGGGKGMRVVRIEPELSSAYSGAKSEALSAFGDDRVYIEKYIASPRHIEVQIMADAKGETVHLGERECSIQRRHQKVVEESPSMYVDPKLRSSLTGSAVMICKESGYVGAGTVEFLVDAEKNFYFLEVNTRLQVEHPVTELRTGLDLVREQIRIAQGEALGYSQADITFSGHAIECRIYAEDPENGFLPSTGTIVHLRPPGGAFVREERGVEAGSEISPYYDPLLSKLITWGSDRHDAISHMRRALAEYELFGVKNNLAFCLWLMNHADFISADISTDFIGRAFTPGRGNPLSSTEEDIAVFAAITESFARSETGGGRSGSTSNGSGWLKKRDELLR